MRWLRTDTSGSNELKQLLAKAHMISFSTLGTRSGFGNHLFQYAFLRSTARRLGVKFYCPKWIGDSVFCLDDKNERAEAPTGIVSEYREPYDCTGLNESALQIGDGTNIQGYFQTEKYFDREQVHRWYRFKEEKIADIQTRFHHVNFASSVGLQVRLGDFVTVYGDLFYVARRSYYKRAIKLVPRKDSIVVFSDDVPRARILLGDLGTPVTFIEDYEPYEGLYLESQCRDFICSPSTYGWWGAWLNSYPDKVVIAPKEGPFRPGAPVRNDDFWPDNWIKIQALRHGLDHYQVIVKKRLISRVLSGAVRRAATLFRQR